MDAEAAYRRYRGELVGYLCRLTGEPAVAEDVAQEAFARLLETPGEKRNARAWLYAVARNLVRERARIREGRRQKGDRASLRPEPAPTPDDEYLRKERIERVRAALSRLRPRDRELLLMREQGYVGWEIARELDISPNSVGKLTTRAFRKLADAYAELDVRPEEEEGRKRSGSGGEDPR